MAQLTRRAGRRDLEAIQSLWERLRREQTEAEPRLSTFASAGKLVSEHREVILADPRTGFFVAEEDGDVVGFLHAQIEPIDPIHPPERRGTVVDLFVALERRRQGLGSRLLEYSLEWFQSHNASQVRVTAPVIQPEAARFLQARGMSGLSTTYTLDLEG